MVWVMRFHSALSHSAYTSHHQHNGTNQPTNYCHQELGSKRQNFHSAHPPGTVISTFDICKRHLGTLSPLQVDAAILCTVARTSNRQTWYIQGAWEGTKIWQRRSAHFLFPNMSPKQRRVRSCPLTVCVSITPGRVRCTQILREESSSFACYLTGDKIFVQWFPYCIYIKLWVQSVLYCSPSTKL